MNMQVVCVLNILTKDPLEYIQGTWLKTLCQNDYYYYYLGF